jgi:hypothetical protein
LAAFGVRLLGVAVAVALIAGCSAASSDAPVAPTTPSPSPVVKGPVLTISAVARSFAGLDKSSHDAGYLAALHQLRRRCRAHSPATLRRLATAGDSALTQHHVTGASYLSVLVSLEAGAKSAASPADCAAVGREFVAEVDGPLHAAKNYGGYAATTAAWAAAHQADPAHPDGYLPKLADGDDSNVIAGDGRVTTLTHNFDPPLSQPIAIGVIRNQLLPGGLKSVYTLPTPQCYEVIYLSPSLGTLLSSSALGVMIELTSGHGVTSHYDTALVDRAILTVGGRIGGQPCV